MTALARLVAEGLSRAEALRVLTALDRIKEILRSQVAKDRQRCEVTVMLCREFERLGIVAPGVVS